MNKLNSFFVLAAVVLLTSCNQPKPVSALLYKSRHNLPYGPGASQTYDFYEPVVDIAGSPRPALLVIHGGGYVAGDKSWAEKVARKFCPWGYVVVGINYTLAPTGLWPTQLDDAQAALNHMRTSPWMNIREPIAGFGVSAGAHLTSALHLQRDLPLAIGASGPWDMINASNEQQDISLRLLLGLPEGAPLSPADRAMISPVTWVKPDADMLLVHATGDPLIPYQNAINFKAALQGVGAKVILVTINSDSHSAAWNDATLTMFRWLKEKQ
jgi:acetyl esterase/lipase